MQKMELGPQQPAGPLEALWVRRQHGPRHQGLAGLCLSRGVIWGAYSPTGLAQSAQALQAVTHTHTHTRGVSPERFGLYFGTLQRVQGAEPPHCQPSCTSVPLCLIDRASEGSAAADKEYF